MYRHPEEVLRSNASAKWQDAANYFYGLVVNNRLEDTRSRAITAWTRHRDDAGHFRWVSSEDVKVLEGTSRQQLITITLDNDRDNPNPSPYSFQQDLAMMGGLKLTGGLGDGVRPTSTSKGDMRRTSRRCSSDCTAREDRTSP